MVQEKLYIYILKQQQQQPQNKPRYKPFTLDKNELRMEYKCKS